MLFFFYTNKKNKGLNPFFTLTKLNLKKKTLTKL